jgi:hypothetical protein
MCMYAAVCVTDSLVLYVCPVVVVQKTKVFLFFCRSRRGVGGTIRHTIYRMSVMTNVKLVFVFVLIQILYVLHILQPWSD